MFFSAVPAGSSLTCLYFIRYLFMKQNANAFSSGPILLYPVLACTGFICAAFFSEPGLLLRNWGFLCILFLIARFDTDCRKIPDRCILAAAGIAVLFTGPAALAQGLISVLLILLLLSAAYLILRSFGKRILRGKRRFLGGGDVKLLMAAGLFLQPFESLSMVFLAGLLGIVTAFCFHFRKEESFPFGPAIAAAAAVMLFR